MPRLSRNALSPPPWCVPPDPGNYVDGNGLMLRVRKSGSAPVGPAPDHPRGGAWTWAWAAPSSSSSPTPARSRPTTAPSPAPAATRDGRQCRRSRRPKPPASRRSARSGAPTGRRTGAAPWTATCCRSSAPCRWTRWAAPRCTRCCARSRLRGKHATVKMAGSAITAVLEWARIAEFRAEGSPVATVRRRLPKRVGGPKHYPALHFSGGCRRAGEDRRHELRAPDEAGDPVHRADGVAAGGGTAGDVGAVRPGGRGVGQARAGDEDGEVPPGAAVAPSARRAGRSAEGEPRRAGIPGHASGGDVGIRGDDAGAAQRRRRGVGPRVPVKFQGAGRGSTT